jgi:hypothetical protein
MSELPNRSSGDSATTVQISPPDIVRRRVTAWGGVRAEVIEVIRRDQFEYKFHAPHHLLIMSERTSRDDGETLVDGLPTVRGDDIPNIDANAKFNPLVSRHLGIALRHSALDMPPEDFYQLIFEFPKKRFLHTLRFLQDWYQCEVFCNA